MATNSDLGEEPNPGVPAMPVPHTSSYGIFNRIVLCAIDPNPHSKEAFEWYLHHVWKSDDLIVLAHCPEPPYIPWFSKKGITPPIDRWMEILEEMNKKTRKLELEYEGICVEKKLRYKVRSEMHNKPGNGICKIAKQEKAELIVMGCRGHGMFRRALMGSVSESIVRSSGLPCLVIPPEY